MSYWSEIGGWMDANMWPVFKEIKGKPIAYDETAF
jgi:hypothetical protein